MLFLTLVKVGLFKKVRESLPTTTRDERSYLDGANDLRVGDDIRACARWTDTLSQLLV